MIILLDMDGTLTAPRARVPDEMEAALLRLCSEHSVHIVTGADYGSVRSQLTGDILSSVKSVFACGGNEHYVTGGPIERFDHTFDPEIRPCLFDLVRKSNYPGPRTGHHIQTRTGQLNVSVPGHGSSTRHREQYAAYDERTGDRKRIVDGLLAAFPQLEAYQGGMVSVDVNPSGMNKSRAYRYVRGQSDDRIVFIADKIRPAGNDWPLVQCLIDANEGNEVINVTGPQDTLQALAWL